MRSIALALALTSSIWFGCHRTANADRVAQLPPEAPSRSHTDRLTDGSLRRVEVGADRMPRILILHDGPGFDHTYLRPWLDSLAQRSQLEFVDVRGHGRSAPPADASGYSVAAAAADLQDLAMRLGNDEPLDVLAHGFGATIAVELAARHPERIRRLVLVDPMRDGGQVRIFPVRAREVLGDAGWQRLSALTTPQGTLRDAHDVGEYLRRLGALWWHTRPSDTVLDRMARDMVYREESATGFRVDLDGWDGRIRARDVRAPTLVISGADDRAALPTESRSLADALPHGTYTEIANAGHCPFIEQPAAFLAAVDRFLRGERRPE